MAISNAASEPRVSARGEPFFLILAIVAMLIVIAGFGGVQLVPGLQTRPVHALVMVHGGLVFGWFAMLITQPFLVRTGDLKRHMQMGQASLVLVAAIIVTNYMVTRSAYADPNWYISIWSHDASTMLPFMDIATFALACALGYRYRRAPAAHKRLMLLAGLFMIDPATARLIAAIGAPGPFILVLEFALFASLLVYDWRSLGRPHWTSVMGLAIFLVAMALKMVVAHLPIWSETLGPAIFG